MVQLVLIALGGLVLVMGLVVLLRGELKVSGSRTLEGGSARVVGLIVLAIGLGTIGYAWLL